MGDIEQRDRTRPDGVEVRWACALARGVHRGVAPFLLAEQMPRDERVPRERAHANGVSGIRTVTGAADDLTVVPRGEAEGPGAPGPALAYPGPGPMGARFAAGPHPFPLLAPA